MEFRILGPLEVDAGRGGGPLPLGGPKQRAVLAHLVLRANHVVPAEVLIDGLWGEEPPEAARGTLQAYVSRLRSVLGDDRLEGRPPGYVLHAEPGEVDAERFEALVRDARADAVHDPASAVAVFQEALAMWRGPALADLAQETSLAGEISRLDELRLTATEEEISAELALGQHARLVGQLEALTKEHPLRERLWGDLMLALYRSGRQAEALEAYQRARQVLADDLGIDPSRRLQRLHEQILAQDPGLSSPSRPMPAARPVAGELQPDAELAGYRIEDLLGRGGMGTVYLAEDLRLRRRVALKVLSPELSREPGFRERFVRESQIAAGIEHPGIVPIYQAGEADGRLYIAMRYVRGSDLRRLLAERGPLEPERAVRIVRHVAEALDAAHAEGLVHRDVKPGNILLVEGTGGEGRDLVYLSDFGLTKRLESSSGTLTRTGQFVGTVDYVAPEQIEGGTVDARSDGYSLACVLFECLAGTPPHRKDSEVATLYAHLNDQPPKVTDARPDLPPELDRVLAKGLAKEPNRRYATCGELTAAARAAIAPLAAETPGTPAAPPWYRKPALAVAGIAAVVLTAAGVALALAGSGEPSVVRTAPTGSPSPTPTPHFATANRPPTRDEQRLLALLPEDLRATCAPAAEPVGSVGDSEERLGTVACDGGDVEALYSLFASRDAMDAAFGHRVYDAGAYTGDCATDHTAQDLYTVDGEAAGRVLCDRGRDTSILAWTDERLFVLGEAIRDDAGDLSLYEWWLSAGPVVPGTTTTKDGGASAPAIPEGSYLVTITDPKTLNKLGITEGIPQTLGIALEDGRWWMSQNGARWTRDEGSYVLTKGPAMVLTSGSSCSGESGTYRWEMGSDGSIVWSLVGPEGGGRCNPGPWPATDRAWTPSPNGQLVYEAYGGIFLLDLEHLTVTNLTPSTGQLAGTGQHEDNITPTWSPDGTRIVFASDRDGDLDLYVMDADGSDLRRLTNEDGNEVEPAWSPGETRIAYHHGFVNSVGVEGGGFGPLILLTLDGDQPVSEVLVSDDRLRTGEEIIGRPAWSPDGSRIAFRTRTIGLLPDTGLYVINADGSGLTRVGGAHEVAATGPVWTPDGERVVFWGDARDGGQLWSVRPDGSDLRPFIPEVTGSSVQIPSWSPDGDWIALGGSNDDANLLRVMSADGDFVFILGVNTSDPEWRPAGA